jgi:hypothetical protein
VALGGLMNEAQANGAAQDQKRVAYGKAEPVLTTGGEAETRVSNQAPNTEIQSTKYKVQSSKH